MMSMKSCIETGKGRLTLTVFTSTLTNNHE